VKDPDKPGLLDLCADLLPALARRCVPWALVIVDEAAGKAPEPETRLDGATAEQNSSIDLDHDCRADLWVVPQDEVVVWTCFVLATLDDPRHQLGAAFDAEVAR
jgi:hypothetical protein